MLGVVHCLLLSFALDGLPALVRLPPGTATPQTAAAILLAMF